MSKRRRNKKSKLPRLGHKSRMPFGTHGGKPLYKVPADYLLWFFETRWGNRKWPALYGYCKANYVSLVERSQKESGEFIDYEKLAEIKT